MRTTRRSFLGGALLAPIGARLFADGEKPLFRFGVMTDTHVGKTVESCGRVKLALELFRDKGCELVINTFFMSISLPVIDDYSTWPSTRGTASTLILRKVCVPRVT